MPYIVASSTGKIELETFEEGREDRLIEDLSKRAVLNVFNRYFEPRELEPVVRYFEEGATVETGSEIPSKEYVNTLRSLGGLATATRRLGGDKRPELIASATEFILEGLHLNRRLNRDKMEGGFRYRG